MVLSKEEYDRKKKHLQSVLELSNNQLEKVVKENEKLKQELNQARKETAKEIWDFLKDYEWTESLKTLFRLKYEIKEKTKEEEFKERIAEEIIDKVDDMIGGKLIAQALREIYLGEEV